MVHETEAEGYGRRPLRKKALAVLCGLVAALLLGEILVRAIGLDTDAHWKIFDADRAAPALPDRIKVDPNAAGRKAFRIAFLGDSFTYGLGVDGDRSFVHLAAKSLNRPQTAPIATINMGEPGADLIKEWMLYNRLKDKVRPHAVVHVLSENDLDIDVYQGLLAIKSLYEDRLWLSSLSRLFAFVECKVRKRIGHGRMLDYLRGGATPKERNRSWRVTKCAIEETKRIVEQDGAVYVLARFPYLGDLTESSLQEVHDRTAELARSLGVPYLDLLDILKDESSRAMHLPDDSHPSEAAHALVAEAFGEFLNAHVRTRFGSSPPRWKSPTRSREEIERANVRFLRKILRLEPTCRSATARLQRILQKKTGR